MAAATAVGTEEATAAVTATAADMDSAARMAADITLADIAAGLRATR